MIRTSHTQRNNYQTCQQQWHYTTNQRLEPKHKSIGRHMGTAYSLGLEHGDKAVHNYYETLLTNNPEDERELLNQYVTVTTCLDIYHELWPEPQTREVPFEVEVAPTILNCGHIDGVADHYLVEDKLLSSMSWHKRSHEWLQLDDQATGYIHAARALNLPTSLMYRVAIKPTIRLKQKETEGEFRKRLTDRLWADREELFLQFPCTRTDEQLDDFAERVTRVVMQQQDGVITPNYSACIGKYGACEFLDLCTGIPGAEKLYQKRPDRVVG